MFLRFVVDNFLSFGEETEFNMIAGNFRNHKAHVYDETIKVLRSAAIYGANGAGKSNMIKAIEYLKQIIYDDGVSQSINNSKFKLNQEKSKQPVYFEIEMIINDKIFRYGVEIDNTSVVSEWLVESRINRKDFMIFERGFDDTGKIKLTFNAAYRKTSKQKLLIELLEENLLKPNELLLCKNEELKIDVISEFRNKIIDDIVIIHPQSKYKHLTAHISSSNEFKNFSNSLLKSFDTGVNKLSIESATIDSYFGDDDDELKEEIITDLENNDGLLMYHKGNDIFCKKVDDSIYVEKLVSSHVDNLGKSVDFDLEDESDGTQRLLDFIPAFNGMLNTQTTFIIDEIDQSLHPALLKSLVAKMMGEKETKGQLIFTTHESNLLDLDIFRQDEIWFVEKDKRLGNSVMYSLSEYKPRYDLDIQKGYLKGRFGAIPFLTDLEELNWSEDEA